MFQELPLNKQLTNNHCSLQQVIIIASIIEHVKPETTVWQKTVHASFRKVVSFDLLFLGLGIPIGAGILAAILGL